jgi:hypothetical protein
VVRSVKVIAAQLACMFRLPFWKTYVPKELRIMFTSEKRYYLMMRNYIRFSAEEHLRRDFSLIIKPKWVLEIKETAEFVSMLFPSWE